jgi:hypothetical protein
VGLLVGGVGRARVVGVERGERVRAPGVLALPERGDELVAVAWPFVVLRF